MSISPHRAPRGRRRLQNAALSAATVLVVLVLLEVGLTLAGYGDVIVYRPDNVLYWRPKPNQTCRTKIGLHRVTVNSCGTRGEEFSAEKPAGVFRVLCLGDSRTFGWGVADTETYPAMLQDSLRAVTGGSRRVEVINTGVNGWSWSQVYAYLRDTGLSYSPDVIVVADAYSYTSFTEDRDAAFAAKMKRSVRFKNLLRQSAVYHYFVEDRFREVYHRLGRLFRSDQRKAPANGDRDPSVPDSDVEYYRTYIARLCDLIDDRGVPFILLHLPAEGETESTRPAVWAIKRDAAEKHGVPFVDVTDAFLESKEKLYLPGDPLHQNALGNRIIAARLYRLIEDKVRG